MSELVIPVGYKQTEVGVIPEEWEVNCLSKFTDLQVGFSFKSAWFGDIVGTRLLRGENVGYGMADWSDTRTLSLIGSDSFSEYTLYPGDIVIGMDRTFTKSGFKLTFLHERDCPCLLVQRVGRFLPRKCNSKFLWFVLSSEPVQSRLKLEQTGMDIPHLSRRDILLPLAAFPPLPEQEAIAEALSDADALIASLEQLIAKKRSLKQGAMQALLTGQQRLPGFEVKPGYQQTEVGLIPVDWEIKSLGEIGEALIGLTYKPSDVKSDGILVLRSSNVQEGELRFDDNVFVDTEVPERIMVKYGDILICVRNGSRDLIGKCAKVDERAKGMTFGAFMAVFRTPLYPFVFHQFQSHIIKKQINEHLGATINQITNKSLNSFKLPIPPTKAEQTAIATILSDMDSEIATLETKLTKARQIKQGMMQELLTGRIRLMEK